MRQWYEETQVRFGSLDTKERRFQKEREITMPHGVVQSQVGVRTNTSVVSVDLCLTGGTGGG